MEKEGEWVTGCPASLAWGQVCRGWDEKVRCVCAGSEQAWSQQCVMGVNSCHLPCALVKEGDELVIVGVGKGGTRPYP